MLIAQINGSDITVADYKVLFPNTSFPPSGPSDAWLTDNGCMKVNLWLPYDQDTQKLVPADPYIDGDYVYTVQVTELTTEEIDQKNEYKKLKIKSQAQKILQDTDWTQMPDVNLLNKDEWTDYRFQIRSIVLNPPVLIDEWPKKPEELWNQTAI
jgi:hypothetical protein